MKIELTIVKNLIKATRFWRENHLILQEFKKFRKVVALAIFFAITAAFLEGITVSFIASFLQGLTNPEEAPIQTGLSWFDSALLATEASPSARTYRLSALLLVAVWLQAVFNYLSGVYSKKASLRLVDCLRRRIFDQLESFELSFYTTANPGALISTLRGEVNTVQQTFNLLANSFIIASKLCAYLLAMLLLSWQLLLGSTFVFSLMSVCLTSLTRRLREASFEVPRANKAFTATALSFLSGIRTVHASGTKALERQRYYTATQKVYDSQIGVIKLSELVRPLIEALGSTLLVSMVVVSYGLLIVTGRLKAAELLTFLFVLLRVTPLVSGLNATRVNFISAQGSLSAVVDLLRRDDKPYFRDGHRPFERLRHSIDFESVDFAYVPNEPVLRELTFSIKQGEATALVGASGAGKTTIADLLSRFYDPTEGRILIDGTDIRDFKISQLRQRMAVVSQDTFIFNATVRENIIYGIEQVDKGEVYQAARTANALEFILDLPRGFDTVLGDRGIRLSGGQRQRIAIARAVLRNPDILILDEATSALDSITERLIQKSIASLSEGRTVVAIAHRLSTIAKADNVIVLEKGRIVEQGSYKELLRNKGELWRYHQVQYELNVH